MIKKTGFTIPKTDVEEAAAPSNNADTSPLTNKARLSKRDIYMASQAAMKSALESPAVAALALTKPEAELPALIEKYAEAGLVAVINLTAKYGGTVD